MFTIAAHLSVLLGWSARALLVLAPAAIASGAFLYWLARPNAEFARAGAEPALHRMQIGRRAESGMQWALVLLPCVLYISWTLFWISACALLFACLVRRSSDERRDLAPTVAPLGMGGVLWILLLASLLVVAAYAVNRSDLDDTFYLAISAALATDPAATLLATDPMLGEPNYPLLFPSYRFASFELLTGVVAYLLSVPSMDVYYVLMLPFWVLSAVAAIFLLQMELLARRWLLAGTVTLVLVFILGEMHRGPANFSVVRIYQGKAVFVSVLVPAIFYLTARYFSAQGSRRDLLLLFACQWTAIGLTNFGMLAGPLAGFAALLSNLPMARSGPAKKVYGAFATLWVALPYLAQVALQSQTSPIRAFNVEPPSAVWLSITGPHQQYLVALLLLAGPVLGKDRITRWRLAVPPFLLLAVCLNPWLSELIAQHITTPPVFWRVVWMLPLIAFCAAGLCLLLDRALAGRGGLPGALAAVGLTLMALPYHTLRPENVRFADRLATWKVPTAPLNVAQHVIAVHGKGRLLAPEDVAGIVTGIEHHPRIVSTRGFYLDLMRPGIGDAAYLARRELHGFVNGEAITSAERVQVRLAESEVGTVVLHQSIKTELHSAVLGGAGFTETVLPQGYSVWTK